MSLTAIELMVDTHTHNKHTHVDVLKAVKDICSLYVYIVIVVSSDEVILSPRNLQRTYNFLCVFQKQLMLSVDV